MNSFFIDNKELRFFGSLMKSNSLHTFLSNDTISLYSFMIAQWKLYYCSVHYFKDIFIDYGTQKLQYVALWRKH